MDHICPTLLTINDSVWLQVKETQSHTLKETIVFSTLILGSLREPTPVLRHTGAKGWRYVGILEF
jgi:hypothetical protein